MATYSPILGNPKPQYEDSNGVPYVGMRLFTYIAGTSTKQNTYTDSINAIANTNPVVLGSDGFPESSVEIHGDDSLTYKIVAAPPGSDDPPTTTLWSIDNISTNNAILHLLGSTALDDGTKGYHLVFYPLTTSEQSAAVTPTNYEYPLGNVLRYGATGDGSTDDLTAINNAISAVGQGGTVYFPKGTYAVSDTINVGTNRRIELATGVTVRIDSGLTAGEVPVFWLDQSYSAIIGAGRDVTYIRSQNACPDGVIKIGATSLSSMANNVEKCQIIGVTVKGPTLYGQTSGDPDIGIHVLAPELSTKFCYFHVIENVGLQDANIGLWMHGWANAHFVRNIYGVHLGNTTLEGITPYTNCFIFMHGGLDNTFSNCFFNQSNDITGLLVKSLDNTGNGSPSVMKPQYNSFSGLVFEQGGTTSNYGLVIIDSATSFYELRTNNYNGWVLQSAFYTDTNFLIASTNAKMSSLESDELISTGNAFVGKSAYDISTTGVQLAADGISGFTADDAVTAIFNRLTTSGTTSKQIAQLRVDGSYFASLSAGSTDRYALASASHGIGVDISTTVFGSMTDECGFIDNTMSCGGNGVRWTVVWAATGTISTSDENEKTALLDIEQVEIDCAKELKTLIKKFKYLDAVAKKGDAARIHFGAGAQTVKATFEKHGLIAENYALFCSDTWYQKTLPDGSIDISQVPANGYVEKTRLGLRYDQLLAFIIAAL